MHRDGHLGRSEFATNVPGTPMSAELADGNLWETFVRVATAHPAHQAYVDPEVVLDYRHLVAAAAEVADGLSARKVGPGDLVAIEMPVGPHFVIGVLAALAVGAAYLPIDVCGPVRRRQRIIDDARPALVLHDDDALVRLARLDARMRAVDPHRHHPGTGDHDPAYVIYTSGSTGLPKGVVVPARGVHNLVAAFQNRAPLGPGARHGWWTSPGFDVSVYEMWSALYTGGAIVPVPDMYRRDVDATLAYLAEQAVDSAYLPPQFLPTLRDRLLRGEGAPRLRRLLTGVEPIPMGLLSQLRSHRPELVVINAYGPTEATVCTTMYTVPDRCPDPERRTPIGTVIEGNRGFVLDERLSPVEPGQPGELFIAGRGLAIGYLHDPGRTAERFVPALDGDGLMYRTGDMVVADAAGDLTFLGRVDDQIKIDGVRVEPSETEAALRRLPEVADVAVLPWPASDGGRPVLTAFVVLAEEVTGRDWWHGIKAHLTDELPAPALPRRFVSVERIPMTGDGKLDRASLPRWRDRPSRPSGNAYERAVEKACQAVLTHVPPSVLDLGFAELGGDSLQATQLAVALSDSTGRTVTAGRVLAAPTLADLAAELPLLPAAAAVDDGTELVTAPLTPGQAGIWAAELAGGSPGAFHEPLAVELTGSVDAQVVGRVLAAVLNRHAVFRGRIDEDSMRFVTDGGPVSVAVGSVAPGEELEHSWRTLVAASHRPAFDLHRGPLVRAAVLAAPRAVRVLVVWHHIVVDAWSARLVLQELGAGLSGNAPGAVERGHAAYAWRQQRFLESTDGKLAVRAAAERVRSWLPPDAGGTGPAPNRCEVQELAVGPRVWSRVRDCARRHGTTTFAVTLAALLDPLLRLAKTRGGFALAVADRGDPADAGAAGYLLTTVPFGPEPRRATGDPSAPAALARARETIATAHAMSRVPFPLLMAELGRRDVRLLAPMVIAWSHDPATALSVPGCTVRPLPVLPLGMRWPWTALLTDGGDRGLSGLIEFPPGVPGDRVAHFASRLESVLETFASHA
jgi:amino acid adenylation domain-containing protein